MAHHSDNLLSVSFLFVFTCAQLFSYLSSSFYQAAQLTRVLDGRLKELSEDAEREVATVTAKGKRKVADNAEKKLMCLKRLGRWRRRGPRS